MKALAHSSRQWHDPVSLPSSIGQQDSYVTYGRQASLAEPTHVLRDTQMTGRPQAWGPGCVRLSCVGRNLDALAPLGSAGAALDARPYLPRVPQCRLFENEAQ